MADENKGEFAPTFFRFRGILDSTVRGTDADTIGLFFDMPVEFYELTDTVDSSPINERNNNNYFCGGYRNLNVNVQNCNFHFMTNYMGDS